MAARAFGRRRGRSREIRKVAVHALLPGGGNLAAYSDPDYGAQCRQLPARCDSELAPLRCARDDGGQLYKRRRVDLTTAQVGEEDDDVAAAFLSASPLPARCCRR